MKSISTWVRDYQSVVDNGRNHSMVIDLPVAKGGSNNGPTALELCVMSLSGCIGTIFAMVAKKMRLEFSHLDVIMEATQAEEAKTITDVHFDFEIITSASEEQVKKCLDLTIGTCPVGVLYKQAGVNISYVIDIKQ